MLPLPTYVAARMLHATNSFPANAGADKAIGFGGRVDNISASIKGSKTPCLISSEE